MIVLAIDPGTRVAGYTILYKQGSVVQIVACGVVKCPQEKSLQDRIAYLYSSFNAFIEQFKVVALALETPFLGKNAANFLKLGYIRGILYLLASQHRLIVYEFSPRQVKSAITGSGNASKDQVARMVQRLFPQFTFPATRDATDACAVGLCTVWAPPRVR